jgi:hypothetical protein
MSTPFSLQPEPGPLPQARAEVGKPSVAPTRADRADPEPLRARMAEQGAVRAVVQRGIQHAATMLTDQEMELIAKGLELIRGEEGLLSAIVQRGLYSNSVLRQIASSGDLTESDPVLLRDVVRSELTRLEGDARTTTELIQTSKLAEVLEGQRENLALLGSILPDEDVNLLKLLGVVHAEQAIAVALARAKRDLDAQFRRQMVEIYGSDIEEQGRGPIPALEPFQHAPQYVAAEVAKVDESLARSDWKPWKGIFKMVQGTVLGAADLAFALSTVMSPALIMSVVTSVAGSIGSFGEGIDELSKRPKLPQPRSERRPSRQRMQ